MRLLRKSVAHLLCFMVDVTEAEKRLSLFFQQKKGDLGQIAVRVTGVLEELEELKET